MKKLSESETPTAPTLPAVVPPGANKNFADRPQLDPAKEHLATPESLAIASAEAETAARMAEKAERERQEAEALEAHTAAEAARNAKAPIIKTRSELAKLSPLDQTAFRHANGTVIEDPVS